MIISVGCLLVLLSINIQVALCDVLVVSRNDVEGSLCYLRNRTRGVCRSFCDDPDQSWADFKDDICNPRKRPTLYCCINKVALNSYPTLYDVCMKAVLAETSERGRAIPRRVNIRALNFIEQKIEEWRDDIMEECNQAARMVEDDERQYFLRNCYRIKEVSSGMVRPTAQYRQIDYPSIVGIGRTFDGGISWSCTGHFIHPLFVLTSATCITESRRNNDPSSLKYPNVVRFGRLDLFDEDFSSNNPTSSFTYDIERIVLLEQYNEDTIASDIALLKVNRNVEEEPKEHLHLKPIPACLWTKETTPNENLFVLAYTNVFHKGNVSSINPTECSKKLNIDELDKSRACYVCNLEDKGPMVASLHYSQNLDINVPYLVGIGTPKMPCNDHEPAHFTLVSPYLSIIEDIVSGN